MYNIFPASLGIEHSHGNALKLQSKDMLECFNLNNKAKCIWDALSSSSKCRLKCLYDEMHVKMPES